MDDIMMIDIASCDGLQVSKLESSSDHDLTYPRLVGFSWAIFDLGG